MPKNIIIAQKDIIMSIPEKIINIMSVYIIMFCPLHFNVYLTNIVQYYKLYISQDAILFANYPLQYFLNCIYRINRN